jgi:AraC-like DNA-binding protein
VIAPQPPIILDNLFAFFDISFGFSRQNHAMTQSSLSYPINVDWIIDALHALGLGLEEIMHVPAIAAARQGQGATVIPFESYLALLNWASTALHDPLLGLHIGARMEPEQLGLFGYLLRNSRTVGEYCLVLSRYIGLIAPNIALTFTEGRDISLLSYQILSHTRQNTQHDVDHSLATLTTFLRAIIGPDWHPACVCLVRPAPEHAEEMAAFFQTTLHFNQPRDEIAFSSALLDIAITQSDPNLLAILRKQAEQALAGVAKNPDIINRTRIIIVNELQSNRLTSDHVARQLNLSRTSFYERLKEKGTSYQTLKDEVVLKIAREALADTNIPLSELAFMLGYSEHSAFVRGFTRLAGQTPLAYRKSIALPGCVPI